MDQLLQASKVTGSLHQDFVPTYPLNQLPVGLHLFGVAAVRAIAPGHDGGGNALRFLSRRLARLDNEGGDTVLVFERAVLHHAPHGVRLVDLALSLIRGL